MNYAVMGLPQVLAQGEHETTETAEEHNPILPEPGELIFGGLAFLLVFVTLARVAFPRLRQGMEARTEKIRGDLERAEQAKREAETMVARYEERLREARAEAGGIIDEARKTADSMRRDLMAKAEDGARQLVGRAQEEIRAEREQAFQDLRRQVGELSVELAARVIGSELDRERQLKLVDEFIDELASQGNGQRRQEPAETGASPGGKSAGGTKRAGKSSGSKSSGSKSSGSKRGGSKASVSKRTGPRKRGG